MQSTLSHDTHQNLLNWLETQDLVLQRWRDEVLALPDADVRFVERLEAHRSWLAWEMGRLIGVGQTQAS